MKPHPVQRDLNEAHLQEMKRTWGSSLQTLSRESMAHVMIVIAIPLDSATPGLTREAVATLSDNAILQSQYNFLVISGCHRLATLKALIMQQCEDENQAARHHEAWWSAKIYASGVLPSFEMLRT